VLYRVVSYLVYRLDRVVPWFVLPAALIVVRADESAGAGRRTARRVCVVLAAAACAWGILSFASGTFSKTARENERAASYLEWSGALDEMAARIPAGETVVADPVTSYSIPAVTPLHVLCTLDQHAPPNDRRASERMLAARDIISPYTTHARRTELLRAWGARYVAISTVVPQNVVLDYWTLTPPVARRAIERFDGRPDLFERILERNGIVVYRWTGRDGDDTKPPTPMVARLPRQTTAMDAVFGPVELVAARLHASDLARGALLPIDLYWRARNAPPGNYVVSIRLDARSLVLPLHGRPFPKITRKLLERLRGVRYRSRTDRMTGGGIFGPGVWPEGALVHDTVEVPIPRDLAAGRYTVRAIIRRRAHIANHRLRDFFFDDDSYNGAVIGTVTIEG